jgi:hypothetical protein
MSDMQPEDSPMYGKAQEGDEVQVTCPKCGHGFWHKIVTGLKQAGESIGNAIGDAKYGGTLKK